MENKYYLGLDIGTNSVGWALTNEHYELVHLRGKSAWGVHLFEEAKTAEGRRTYRSNRRRKARQKRRINLLQELFAEEMAKVDSLFFIRLNNSNLFADDKEQALLGQKDTLFSDQNFTDKEFHKQYKTIYHLQKQLIEDKETKFDLRFIYLALHHLIKYRGHFILEGQDINVDNFGEHQINEGFTKINDYLTLNNLIESPFTKDKLAGFQRIVEKERGVNNTKRALKTLFATKDKFINSVLDFLASGKTKLGRLFVDFELAKEEGDLEIDLSSEDYENKYLEAEEIIGEDHVLLIDAIKQLYDYMVVARLMNGEKFFAHAMVTKYNKHREDLRKLKKLIKTHGDKETYDAFFKAADSLDNYSAYIGMTKIKGKKRSVKKPTKPNEVSAFFNRIKKIIKDIDNPQADDIRAEIEKGIFLPRVTSVENAQIPYQFYAYQATVILENAARHYPFLNKEEDGLTLKDKILKILTFRVPYYVGPLSDLHNVDDGGFSWVVRKNNEKVTPWNLDEVVDLDKTAEKFILNMTNKCSYLIGEDVLPKQSLLYEEYNLLNHLNVIQINGQRLSKAEKEALIEDVAKKQVNVTHKAISKYFANRLQKDVNITGFDVEAKVSLSSFHKFNRIFPGRINNEPANAALIKKLEDIIFLGTIYTSQSDYARRILKDKQFKEFFSSEELLKLSRLRFKGWGNFSRMLLSGFDSASKKASEGKSLTYQDEKTGNQLSIIEVMREESLNFNEILYHEKYQFHQLIREFNLDEKTTADVDDLLDSYYLSPAVKRSIRRVIKIVDELITVNYGIVPDKIFVEVTREDEATRKGKGRTTSRLEQLKAIYEKAIKDSKDFADSAKKLNEEGVEDAYVRPKRMYLYYLQNGKCAYTGEPINLKDADIDHIIPQSLKKDDSFDNLVLVKSKENKKKDDQYPLDLDVIRRQKPFWKQLKDIGLMSNEKYERLTRTKELTAEDLEGFINRQLVITNQANKAVAEILGKLYGTSTIVYSKASNVSDFRQKFDLIKGREINNAHHAHDAYLNVVVGNYFHTRFGARYYYRKKEKDEQKPRWNPKRAFDFSVTGCWDKNRDMATIKKMLKRRDILFTRMPIIGTGEFYDLQASKAGPNLLPFKENGPLSDTERYGGYSGKNAAYFAIVEHQVKKARERIFVSVPVLIDLKIKQGQTTLIDYLQTQLGLVEPSVVYSPIPLFTIIRRGKSLQYISGSMGEFKPIYARNAIEPYFDEFTFEYLCLIYKYFEQEAKRGKKKNDNQDSGVEQIEEVAEEPEQIQVIFTSNTDLRSKKEKERLRFITRENNEKVFKSLIEQIKKPIYETSYGIRRETIIENQNVFYGLDIKRQAEIIKTLHSFLKTGVPGKVDLNEFGVKSGELTISYKVDEFTIVKQSITGLYQKEINIQKV